jgi:thiol-disulfide isomerase/thioredoxin
MKKAFLVVLVLASSHILFAQTTPAAATPAAQDQAPYLKFPTIPPFHLLKLDSATYLTKDDIKKHHRTIVMFFSPTCDHCKHQTESILSNAKKFKDIEIVMATYQPFDEMKQFYAEYHLAKYPNIKIGRDDKFFLAPYYKVRNLPYLALYDRKGDLVTTFEGTQTVDTILKAFEQKAKGDSGN